MPTPNPTPRPTPRWSLDCSETALPGDAVPCPCPTAAAGVVVLVSLAVDCAGPVADVEDGVIELVAFRRDITKRRLLSEHPSHSRLMPFLSSKWKAPSRVSLPGNAPTSHLASVRSTRAPSVRSCQLRRNPCWSLPSLGCTYEQVPRFQIDRFQPLDIRPAWCTENRFPILLLRSRPP